VVLQVVVVVEQEQMQPQTPQVLLSVDRPELSLVVPEVVVQVVLKKSLVHQYSSLLSMLTLKSYLWVMKPDRRQECYWVHH
jgi:hypothetical protein